MPCPSCHARKHYPKHYLCASCWYALPQRSRNLLNLHDEHARVRLLRLLEAVHRGTRPQDITPETLSHK
jgi:hypothetical protein